MDFVFVHFHSPLYLVFDVANLILIFSIFANKLKTKRQSIILPRKNVIFGIATVSECPHAHCTQSLGSLASVIRLRDSLTRSLMHRRLRCHLFPRSLTIYSSVLIYCDIHSSICWFIHPILDPSVYHSATHSIYHFRVSFRLLCTFVLLPFLYSHIQYAVLRFFTPSKCRSSLLSFLL